MKMVHRIDTNGMFIEDILLEDDELTPGDCVEVQAEPGFHHPQWDSVNKVWGEGKSEEYVLAHLKTLKIEQIKQAYEQNMLDGFASSCTGVYHIYDYSEESQKLWVEVFSSLQSGFIPDAAFPLAITLKDGEVVFHTKLQLQQFGSELTMWKFGMHSKSQALTNSGGAVMSASTVEVLDSIVWLMTPAG